MPIRAKFIVENAKIESDSEQVFLRAVYSDDPGSPNHSWSKYTPAGTLQMAISNPDAQGQLVEGKEYYLDITPAE